MVVLACSWGFAQLLASSFEGCGKGSEEVRAWA